MRKPCTDCPENEKHHIKPDGGRGAGSSTCMAGRLPGWSNVRVSCGYYEKIANCVDYAEFLAWLRENRKKRKGKTIITEPTK